jgi:hypothetical protein
VVAATGGAGRLEILDLNNPAADRTALKFNDTGFAFHVLSTTSGPFIVEAPGTGMYGGQLLSLNTTTGETTPVLDEVPKATDWASVGNRVYAVCPDGLLCYNAEEHSVTRFPIPGIDPEGGLGCTDAGIVIHLVSGPLAIVQPLDGSTTILHHSRKSQRLKVVGGFPQGVIARVPSPRREPPFVVLTDSTASPENHPVSRALRSEAWASPSIVNVDSRTFLVWVDEVRNLAIVRDVRSGNQTAIGNVSLFSAAPINSPEAK